MPRKPRTTDRAKPSGLPELRLHRHGQHAAGFVPDAVFVAGFDVELIMAGRQLVVKSHARIAGFRPGDFVAFQPIFEPHLLRARKNSRPV